MLACEEEEELIFDDRCPYGETIVLKSRRRFGVAEGVLAFKEFVVVGVVRSAVEDRSFRI